jgi:GH25 family lysozyme M1 (1,4-beta-N-acetylmuramidase)
MTNPIVIDLSHHQPDPINWAALLAGGTIGIIHKATEGSTYVDDKFHQRVADARAAGIFACSYHFLSASNMPAQMEHYLATVNPKEGERVILDHENSGTSIAELEECVRYLMQVRPDLQITVYSGHVIEEQIGQSRNALLADNTDLWTAAYNSTPGTWAAGTWPMWSLWQYTDKATVDGINGYVDANEWSGTVDQLVEWFGITGGADMGEEGEEEHEHIPPPVVEDGTAVVSIITTGHVRVIVNCQVVI